ncbi:restriction endonuclease subunit S [Vibrio alginolyticus]|uniref:restriction endonuclease subunit S n=1 Tax=Vibrio alginolyticus TaxID=663 RepID=UPI000802A6E2|nr:restriction endonuclease subunit S [Vibrio alginolyticus]ANP63861.1 hypothetical protein BAU10_02190 [Vibrio alginolyticus]
MRSDITLMCLEDAVEALIDYRGKTPKKTTSGVPLITAKVIKNGEILEPNEFIAPENYDSWMVRGLPKVGDVVLTVEAPLGQVAQLTESYVALAQRVVTLRGKEGVLDNTYLKYLLMTPKMQAALDGRSSGSTVKGIKQSELRKVELELPDIDTQRKVASILSSLDNKIANNKAMNQILEKLAQRIFKSWFIDFDPVKANKEGLPFDGLSPEIQALFPSEFEDSELGMIPKGWEVSNIEKYATNVRKNIKKGDIDSDMPYLGLEHINRKCLSVYEHGLGESVTSNKSQFQVNDILLGKLRPYFHKVGIPNFDGVCSTDILVVRPKESFYFEYALNVIYQDRLIDHLTRCSSGTRMPRAKWADVTDYQLATPLDDGIFKAFSKITSPLYQRLLNNCNEVDILSKLRDRLLPKLISGQISVGEVAQELAEAV